MNSGNAICRIGIFYDGSFFAWLRGVITDRGVTRVVLRLPVEEAGGEGESAARVRAFARRLEAAIALPVVLVDERYSSREAAAQLRQSGRRRLPREAIDAAAATIILQQFLDRRRASPGEGWS